MKKLLKTLPFLAIIAIAMAGCLKDKGFDNNEYGIKNPDGSPPAVAFANGKESKTPFGINAVSTSQTVELVLNYTGAEPPATDITVTIVRDSSIVKDYNTKNGTSTVVAPASSVIVPATVVIPAGQRFVTFKITIPNASVFNPALEYGLGIRITSASPNVAIASNLKQLFVALNIKNAYDGKYVDNGTFNHPSYANPYQNIPIQLRTTGPNSVVMYCPLFDELCKPFNVGGGTINRFGSLAPVFTVDPVTKKVTVEDYFGGFMNVDPAYDNRYDPATKTFYVKYGYRANRTRDWTDTLIYKGPR